MPGRGAPDRAIQRPAWWVLARTAPFATGPGGRVNRVGSAGGLAQQFRPDGPGGRVGSTGLDRTSGHGFPDDPQHSGL